MTNIVLETRKSCLHFATGSGTVKSVNILIFHDNQPTGRCHDARKTGQTAEHFPCAPEHGIGRELEAISKLLNENPQILVLVYSDLVVLKDPETGRMGMTAEQVLRCAILKQYRNLTYEELAFHLVDSRSFRAFGKLEWGQKPAASTLQENIKAVSEPTWETIKRMNIEYAAKHDLEKGRTIRLDSTAVASDIHYPTDSTLLQDGIRIITRLLMEGKRLYPTPGYRFSDHRRVVKSV